MLNILEPGNFVRLSQNMEESAGNGINLFETLWYRVPDIGPFVLATAMLFLLYQGCARPISNRMLYRLHRQKEGLVYHQ